MQAIKDDNAQSARVLIATSVMDNGINLKDERLNNLIVFADNETEFIQMLGRKREIGNQVNLYIFKWEKEHFDRRRNQLSRKEEVASDYARDLYSAGIIVEEPSGQGIDWSKSEYNERCFMAREHIWLLNRLLNEENMYDKIKAAFYAKDGYLLLNFLSVYQMDKLKSFYNDIIDKFSKDGEDAFIEEQLRWLGKDEKEIEDMIAQSKITEEIRIRDEVCGMIDNILDDPLTKAKAVDFKNTVRDKMLALVHFCRDGSDKNTVETSLKRNDRPISDKNMDYLRENCNLPYRVEKCNDGETRYVFKRAEQ